MARKLPPKLEWINEQIDIRHGNISLKERYKLQRKYAKIWDKEHRK